MQALIPQAAAQAQSIVPQFWNYALTFLLSMACSSIVAPLLVHSIQKKRDEKEDKRTKAFLALEEEKAKTLLALEVARKELEVQWHENVTGMIGKVSHDIEDLCSTTKKDEQELWNRLYNHGHEVVCEGTDCRITFKGVTIPPGGRT